MDIAQLERKLKFYEEQRALLQANLNAHDGAIIVLKELISALSEGCDE